MALSNESAEWRIGKVSELKNIAGHLWIMKDIAVGNCTTCSKSKIKNQVTSFDAKFLMFKCLFAYDGESSSRKTNIKEI